MDREPEPRDAGEGEPTATPRVEAAQSEPAAGLEATSGEWKRVETAVAPIIRAEGVAIPTPAWGVPVPERVETAEAELVEADRTPATGEPEDMPEAASGSITRQWPGWLALLLAVGTAVLTGVAVGVDGRHASGAATLLAWVAIGCSIAAFLSGVLAAVFNRGRISGIAAALLGLFADPWILLQVLTLLKG